MGTGGRFAEGVRLRACRQSCTAEAGWAQAAGTKFPGSSAICKGKDFKRKRLASRVGGADMVQKVDPATEADFIKIGAAIVAQKKANALVAQKKAAALAAKKKAAALVAQKKAAALAAKKKAAALAAKKKADAKRAAKDKVMDDAFSKMTQQRVQDEADEVEEEGDETTTEDEAEEVEEEGDETTTDEESSTKPESIDDTFSKMTEQQTQDEADEIAHDED